MSQPSLSRRRFLESSGAVALGFLGLRAWLGASAHAAPIGYGPLVGDKHGILDLPRGFSYRVISRRGDTMDDGHHVPGQPDGMGTFPGKTGETILICNHEMMPGNNPFEYVIPERVYDKGLGLTPGAGGTTTIVYDTKQQRVVRRYLSLAGTIRNCAGGPTPWGTWISCEEAVFRSGKHKRNDDTIEFDFITEHDHGYNFEVPARLEPGLCKPVPLRAMGRFNHEAIAVDENTGIVYQTEDRGDGLIYRYIPNHRNELASGGKLQALVVSGLASADTRNWVAPTFRPGVRYPVKWLDLDHVESPNDDLRHRGYGMGAARFARGEGMWRGRDGIYFACTNGGAKQLGQIWRLQDDTLELFVEPNDSNLIENADNLTVAPWGDLIVAEDRSEEVVRLVGITPSGRPYTLARHHKKTEFAGCVFSPDGTTLFANIQGAGLTVAITGPWRRT